MNFCFYQLLKSLLLSYIYSYNLGVYICNGTTLINISEKDILPSNFVNKVVESFNGDFLISTTMGLVRYNITSLNNISEVIIGKNVGVGIIFEDNIKHFGLLQISE